MTVKIKLTKSQEIIWNALKEATNYNDNELKQAMKEYLEQGDGVSLPFSRPDVALKFCLNFNIDALRNEIFQNELKFILQFFPEFENERLSAQEHAEELIQQGYSFKEACDCIAKENTDVVPEGIKIFMYGLVSSFYLKVFGESNESENSKEDNKVQAQPVVEKKVLANEVKVTTETTTETTTAEIKLTKNQKVIWNALKEATGYNDDELKQATQEHYKHGSDTYTQLSHASAALNFCLNIDVLKNKIFQEELKFSMVPLPEFAIELLQAQARIMEFVKVGYDFKEACNCLVKERAVPKDITIFMTGFAGGFYSQVFDED